MTHTSCQGAPGWLKGKYKEEKGPFNACRNERQAAKCSTQAFDGFFFYFSIFDVWVAVNSVRSTGLGNSPLLNNTELGFVLV